MNFGYEREMSLLSLTRVIRTGGGVHVKARRECFLYLMSSLHREAILSTIVQLLIYYTTLCVHVCWIPALLL